MGVLKLHLKGSGMGVNFVVDLNTISHTLRIFDVVLCKRWVLSKSLSNS